MARHLQAKPLAASLVLLLLPLSAATAQAGLEPALHVVPPTVAGEPTLDRTLFCRGGIEKASAEWIVGDSGRSLEVKADVLSRCGRHISAPSPGILLDVSLFASVCGLPQPPCGTPWDQEHRRAVLTADPDGWQPIGEKLALACELLPPVKEFLCENTVNPPPATASESYTMKYHELCPAAVCDGRGIQLQSQHVFKVRAEYGMLFYDTGCRPVEVEPEWVGVKCIDLQWLEVRNLAPVEVVAVVPPEGYPDCHAPLCP